MEENGNDFPIFLKKTCSDISLVSAGIWDILCD